MNSTPTSRRVHFAQNQNERTDSPVSSKPMKSRRRGRKDWFEEDPAKETKKRKKAIVFPDNTLTSSTGTLMPAVKSDGQIYAVQDSGAHQMLHDEITYLCTHFASKSSAAATDAMMDVATLLSNTKQRQTILSCTTDNSKSSPTQAILNALSTSCRFSIKYDPEALLPLFRAMSFVWHFLSVECTPSDKTTSAQARLLRQIILSNTASLEGLLQLILLDPVVSRVRGKQSGSLTMHAAGEDESVTSLSTREDILSSSPGSISSNTEDSYSSSGSGSVDPTAAGRRRKRRKIPKQRLSTINEDDLSFSSPVKQTHSDLGWIKEISLDYPFGIHSCETTTEDKMTLLPLVALTRIVTGKISDESESCLDDDSENEEDRDSEEDIISSNPILMTNHLLAQGGIIPLLSLALSESVAAAGAIVNLGCSGCVVYLQERIKRLSSLVDGACLLSDTNRVYFCKEGYTDEAGGYLVVGLVSLLGKFLCHQDALKNEFLFEILLSSLRALTSITHECIDAAQELESAGISGRNGLCVIMEVLHTLATRKPSDSTEKIRYDASIFCLNTLANLVESGTSSRKLVDAKLPSGSGLFCAWLSEWLTQKTESFQEALVESTFNSSPSRHQKRKLEKEEDENLVLAGNGFVLLACLLVAISESEQSSKASFVEQMSKIPGDGLKEKISFIKNVLRAFCNFYHFSVGDLAVAIITPVKKIMMKLDQIRA